MKVLIAEDDRASNALVKSLLFRWGFDVVTTFNGTETWKVLREKDAPQIAIIDWMMPGIDGLEVCRRIREDEKGGDQYTYVIILTAKSEREDVVTGIDAGADDYIVKPFNKEELRARLTSGQRIIELQTALRAANRKLLLMSRLDPLTGALSRSAILDDLDLALYRCRREKIPLSVSLVDIDSLKEVNERAGRLAGDRVLQECVRRITACLRRTDCFGRYESDSFLVVLPAVNRTTGMDICLRIQEAIARREMGPDDHALPVTVSQCLAAWDGKATVQEIIVAAEQTLAATKDSGPNRIELPAFAQ
ncbi:MAG: GGDEF domain-containing response regulator [Syntrophales bacterium]